MQQKIYICKRVFISLSLKSSNFMPLPYLSKSQWKEKLKKIKHRQKDFENRNRKWTWFKCICSKIIKTKKHSPKVTNPSWFGEIGLSWRQHVDAARPCPPVSWPSRGHVRWALGNSFWRATLNLSSRPPWNSGALIPPRYPAEGR